MKKLETVNCEEIMTQPLKPIEFVVDNLISQGLFILAGAPKIGKSWLALDMALSIAKGESVLNAAFERSHGARRIRLELESGDSSDGKNALP